MLKGDVPAIGLDRRVNSLIDWAISGRDSFVPLGLLLSLARNFSDLSIKRFLLRSFSKE